MSKTTDFVPIEKNKVFALYRRGKQEHIKALYERGELYINTIDYIRNCDDNWQRTDPYDGISHRQFFGDATVKLCDVGRDVDKEGISIEAQNFTLIKDLKPKGNIYCLSGIYSDHLLGDREDITFRTSDFGETLILIYNPRIFLERVKRALNEKGYFSIKHNKVHYYKNEYSGAVGVFKKHEKFQAQNEFRIFVPNKSNKLIKVQIGSLKDIASIENNNCLQHTYTDEKIQLMKFL